MEGDDDNDKDEKRKSIQDDGGLMIAGHHIRNR